MMKLRIVKQFWREVLGRGVRLGQKSSGGFWFWKSACFNGSPKAGKTNLQENQKHLLRAENAVFSSVARERTRARPKRPTGNWVVARSD
jgi:hypothetical protein